MIEPCWLPVLDPKNLMLPYFNLLLTKLGCFSEQKHPLHLLWGWPSYIGILLQAQNIIFHSHKRCLGKSQWASDWRRREKSRLRRPKNKSACRRCGLAYSLRDFSFFSQPLLVSLPTDLQLGDWAKRQGKKVGRWATMRQKGNQSSLLGILHLEAKMLHLLQQALLHKEPWFWEKGELKEKKNMFSRSCSAPV